MDRRSRLKMDPSKTPETDLSGFQEQGGYIDQETIDDLQKFDKEKKLDRRTISNRKKRAREQVKVDEEKKRQQTKKEMEEFYKGPDEETIKQRQIEIDKIKGRLYGGEVEDAKRQDDMKRGDYLRNPEGENGFSYRHALKIGMQAAQTARMIQTFPYRAAGGFIKALTIGNTLGSYR